MSTRNRHIGLDEKLALLQAEDSLRKWNSLDDKRVCVLCNRLITGRMIDIWKDPRGHYHFHCPTAGCPATAHDWFYHGPTRPPRAGVTLAKKPALSYAAAAAA